MTVFARVAAARSFSAAARDLGISQATASKHVQTLESWLGTRLLNRTTRRVALTDVGASFFAQCTRILEDMETARQTGQTVARLRGSMRVAVPVAFGSSRLPTLVVAFMAENPDLSLNVALCDRPVDVIEDAYDLAIRTGSEASDDAGLSVHVLQSMGFAVCAAPAFLEAHGAPQVPADLARLVCLTDSRYPGDIWRFSGPNGTCEVQVTGRLRSDNGIFRRAAARTGAGVLLAPEFLVRDDIAAGRLVRLLPGYAAPTMRLEAVCPSHRAVSPKVRSFVAFLKERLEE
jgi:DNA-binding transcriptional LysR family regulator